MSIRTDRVWLGVCIALFVLILVLHPAAPANAQQQPQDGPALRAVSSVWGSCWYIVRPGDNLFRIAVRYGVSYRYLALINGLYNPHYLYPGMRLTVPCGNYPPPYPTRPPRPCAPSQTYLVKPGDNLFRIAINFGTTIIALRDANHLWGRALRPNTQLIIPCPGSVQYGNQNQVPAFAGTPVPVAGETPQAPPPTVAPPTNVPIATVVPPPTTETQPAAKKLRVTLQNGAINPNQLDIKLGQSVTWRNADQTNTYTVVSGIPGQPNGVFASPPIPPGGTFVFKFEAGGSYTYYVTENQTMVGQINVSP